MDVNGVALDTESYLGGVMGMFGAVRTLHGGRRRFAGSMSVRNITARAPPAWAAVEVKISKVAPIRGGGSCQCAANGAGSSVAKK